MYLSHGVSVRTSAISLVLPRLVWPFFSIGGQTTSQSTYIHFYLLCLIIETFGSQLHENIEAVFKTFMKNIVLDELSEREIY